MEKAQQKLDFFDSLQTASERMRFFVLVGLTQ